MLKKSNYPHNDNINRILLFVSIFKLIHRLLHLYTAKSCKMEETSTHVLELNTMQYNTKEKVPRAFCTTLFMTLHPDWSTTQSLSGIVHDGVALVSQVVGEILSHPPGWDCSGPCPHTPTMARLSESWAATGRGTVDVQRHASRVVRVGGVFEHAHQRGFARVRAHIHGGKAV